MQTIIYHEICLFWFTTWEKIKYFDRKSSGRTKNRIFLLFFSCVCKRKLRSNFDSKFIVLMKACQRSEQEQNLQNDKYYIGLNQVY